MGDYYNISAIFAEETSVPVRFLHAAQGLGRSLDSCCTDEDLPAQSRVDLPLWLALPLAERGMIRIETPAHYSERFRRRCNAGAGCLTFRGQCPYFYEVGNKISEHLNDASLPEFLTSAFASRYHDLLSRALNAMTGEEVLQYNSKLSQEEQQLFEVGRVSVSETERWLSNMKKTRSNINKGTAKKRAHDSHDNVKNKQPHA